MAVGSVWWEAQWLTAEMTNWMWCWRQSQVSCCSQAMARQSGIFCLTCFLIVGTSSLFFGFEYALHIHVLFVCSHFTCFSTVLCYASTIYGVVICPSVCLSVCHKLILCQAGFWHGGFLQPISHCVIRKYSFPLRLCPKTPDLNNFATASWSRCQ